MTSNDIRCPQCSAHVPPGADWCALCFADLRPQPEPEPDVVVVVPQHEPAPEQTGREQHGEQLQRGKHSRSAATSGEEVDAADEAAFGRVRGLGEPRDPAAMAEFDARASEMLALLAAAESSRPLGPWAAKLESTGSRVFAACVGVAVLVMGALLVMSVVGRFV